LARRPRLRAALYRGAVLAISLVLVIVIVLVLESRDQGTVPGGIITARTT